MMFIFGTEGRNRTDTVLPPLDFESSASTSSATPAFLEPKFEAPVYQSKSARQLLQLNTFLTDPHPTTNALFAYWPMYPLRLTKTSKTSAIKASV